MHDTPHITRAASRRIVLLCGLASATLTVAVCRLSPGVSRADGRSRLRRARAILAARSRRARIAIVDVDERSLAAIGQWPWRRDLIAQLVTRVRELGAAVVALDVIFAEPDRYDASGSPEAGESAPDAALAGALAGGRVMLGYAFTFDPSQSIWRRLRAAPGQPADPAPARQRQSSLRFSTRPAPSAACRRWRGPLARPAFSTPCPTPTVRSGACRC